MLQQEKQQHTLYLHIDSPSFSLPKSVTYAVQVPLGDTRPVSVLWDAVVSSTSHHQDLGRYNRDTSSSGAHARLHTSPPAMTPIPWDTPIFRAIRGCKDLYLIIPHHQHHLSSSSTTTTTATKKQPTEPTHAISPSPSKNTSNDRSSHVQQTVEVLAQAHQSEDQRQYRVALRLYQSLLPSLQGWSGVARILLAMGRPSAAEEAVQCALATDPKNPEVLSIRADILMKEHQYESAMQILRVIPEHVNPTIRTADPTQGRPNTLPLRVYTLRRIGDCIAYLHRHHRSSSSSSASKSNHDNDHQNYISSMFHILSPPPIPVPPPPSAESQLLYHQAAQTGDPIAEVALGMHTMMLDPQQTHAAVATMLRAATTLHQHQHLRPALGRRLAAAFLGGGDAAVRAAADMVLPLSMLDNDGDTADHNNNNNNNNNNDRDNDNITDHCNHINNHTNVNNDHNHSSHNPSIRPHNPHNSRPENDNTDPKKKDSILGAASALSWVSLLLRDYGALSAAVFLMERAVDAVLQVEMDGRPAAGYGLQLMHLLETAGQQYGEALRVAGRCLRQRRDVRGLRRAGETMMMAAEEVEQRRGRWMQNQEDVDVDVTGLEDLDALLRSNDDDMDYDSNNHNHKNGYNHNDNNDMDISPMLRNMKERGDSQYNAEELDVLGLLFTAVKIMYVCGVFPPLRYLVPMIEHLRRAGQPLHHTIIRNEQAYYTSAVMLAAELSCRNAVNQVPESTKETSTRRLYVIGDSHTLTPAWRRFRLPTDRAHEISSLFQAIPLVVTGIKCWHLRPESMFYPKFNFEHVLRRLPMLPRENVPGGQNAKEGLAVMLVLGEIDCREGMIQAVEHGRYNTIEEAAAGTVAIYRYHVVERIIAYLGSSLQVLYVHPAPPVLDPTRHLTRAFNACLRDTFTEYPDPRVVLLDVEKDLVCPEQEKQGKSGLRPQYHLDGTHLHPSYLDHFCNY